MPGQYETQAPAQDRPALPEYLGRKGQGVMSDEDLASIVKGAISQSVQFVDTELSFERARATEFYLGKPFGNEEEGRSQAILTEVRDAVDGMVPSLMRVFFGAEHTVEFVPNRADAVEMAAEMTDYVRYVFEEDNNGFLRTLAVLKDGLIRKIGIFKWGWDESSDTRAYHFEYVTKQELDALASDDDVELIKVVPCKPTKEEDAEYQQMVLAAKQQNQPAPPKPEYYDVDLTRTIKGGRARIWEVPPEEFVYNRQARDLETALLVAHRTDMTKGQLLAMGIKEKDIAEHAGPGNTTDVTLRGNAEEIARRDVAGVGRVVGFGYTNDPEMGDANSRILYCEAWMTLDYDGDGVAELRKICTIGPTYYPVKNDPADERPFALFTPYPEPHTLLGGSVADRTMDIQKINSAILRGIMDSGASSIFPRTVYVEGQASVADIMNTAVGAPMRERVAGAIRTLDVPFTGKDMLPVLTFMQDVLERRVGRQGSKSLDSDALQSTDKDAVNAVIGGREEQIELVARVFAESTLKPLFKGLGRLLHSHQPRSRVVRLRGQYVDVDPRTWDDDMDVTTNIALGATFVDRKVQTLAAVAADQQHWIETLGPSNPMTSLPKLRNTRARILRLQGIQDVDNYYNPIPADWQPPPAPPPQPSPEILALQQEAQMNQLKTVKELAIKRDELQFEIQKGTWDQEFKLRELAANTEIKKYAIDMQFQQGMSTAQMESAIDQDMKEAELTIQAHANLHEQHLAEDQQAHDQMMAERAQDTTDMQAQQAGDNGVD